MSNIVEQARVAVLLDNRDANQAMKELTEDVNKYTTALNNAYKAGDKTALKQSIKDLDTAERNLATFKKQTFEVSKVLNNLNGSSLKDLQRAEREITAEMGKMTRGTKEYIDANGDLVKVKEEIRGIKTEMNGVSKSREGLSKIKDLLPTLSFAAVGAAALAFGKELFDLSKTMESENRRASIVFGDSLGYVHEQADLLSKKMGVTNHEFVAMATSTADLLVPLDFTRESAAKMSVQLQSLTGALDEWTGGSVGATEISNILTKAMLGENEQLKTLGIAIRQDSEEYINLVKHKMETERVTKAQAAAMATLELIQKKSLDAQTAYNTEGNNMLRWQKDASRYFKEFKERIIEQITPQKQQIDLYRLENKEVDASFNALKNKNLSHDAQRKLIEEINTKYGQYLPNLLSEKSNLIEIEAAQKKVNDQIRISVISKALNEQLTEAYKTQQEAVEGLVGAEIERAKVEGNMLNSNMSQQEEENQQRMLNTSEIVNKAVIDNATKQEATIKEKFQKIADYYKIAFAEIESAAAGLNIAAPEGLTTNKQDQTSEEKKQAENLQKLLKGAMSQTEKEKAEYEQRLKDAGLYGKKKEDLTKIQQQGFELLEVQHAANLAGIANKAASENTKNQKLLYSDLAQAVEKSDQEILDIRKQKYEQDLINAGTNVEERKKIEEQYKEEVLTIQLGMLESQRQLLQSFGQDVVEIDKKIAEKKAEIRSTDFENQLTELDERGAALREYNLYNLAELQAQEESALQEKRDKGILSEEEYQQALLEIKLRYAAEYISRVQPALAGLSTFVQTLQDTELIKLETATQKKLTLAGDDANKRKKIEEDSQKAQKEIKKKYADKAFVLQAAQIVASTAQAAISAYNSMVGIPYVGPVLGALAAAAAVSYGVAQLSKAKAERNAVKQLATGKYNVTGASDGKLYSASYSGPATHSGIYANGQPTLINEQGPELILTAPHTKRLQMKPQLFQDVMDLRYPQRAAGNYPDQTTPATQSQTIVVQSDPELKALLKNLTNGVRAHVVYSDITKAGDKLTQITDFAAGR